MAERRIGFKIERLADDILILFIENNPEAQRGVEPGATLLHLGNFDGKTIGGGRLAGDWKQHQDIFALRPGDPHTHSHGTVLASFCLPALGFTYPQIGKADDTPGAKLVPAHVSSLSRSYASTASLTSSNNSSGSGSSHRTDPVSAVAVRLR